MKRQIIVPLSLAAAAGAVFSATLMRLGTDMESPETLRYILIGTVPMAIVLTLALVQLGRRSGRQVLIGAFGLSVVMCVPLESFAYVVSGWNLRGSEVFGRDLPTLLLLLIAWGTVISLLAFLAVFLFRVRSANNSSHDDALSG